jgi:hypothetical protein
MAYPTEGECAGHQEAFIAGFRDAINGRRYRNPIPGLQVSCWNNSGDRNPFHPAFRSCQAYRDESHGQALQCCLRGFDQGTPLLVKHIAKLSEQLNANTRPTDDMDRHCMSDFVRGKDLGTHLCSSLSEPSKSCQAIQGGRYGLHHGGCFHVGMNLALASCPEALNRIGFQWLRQASLDFNPRNQEVILGASGGRTQIRNFNRSLLQSSGRGGDTPPPSSQACGMSTANGTSEACGP